MNYPALKSLIVSLVELTRDAIHIYVGFFCLLASLIIFRLPLTSYRALLFGIIVSCVMEVLDLRLQLASGWPPRWAGSLHDLLNTNLIPFLLILLSRRGAH